MNEDYFFNLILETCDCYWSETAIRIVEFRNTIFGMRNWIGLDICIGTIQMEREYKIFVSNKQKF